uniref:ADP ribosylation factor like GTPase 5A n=1 Tax=Equus caballus TaxID=9796 RepID=A0A9L0SXM8_HORSE
PHAPPLASPARVVAAAAAALEELGEDGGPRGSSRTTRRRCPRARREPRRQRRDLARGRAAWASASLRFLGSRPVASAGAAAAEAEAPARLSPPLQPEPGEARRPRGAGGGSAAREWEFSSPGFGDCSITRFVIVVVDSTDRERISVTREELYKMLAHEDLRKAGLLIFANKQDVKECMTVAEISQFLKLTSIKDHQWHIQACCALTGEGLCQGLEWMMSRLKIR